MLNYRDFQRFSRVRTRLEPPKTQENTGGMGYDSHPFKMVCYFDYFDYFDYFILNYRDFKRFSFIRTCLELPEIQENTGGMAVIAIPPKWYFISIF
jgi:hypothetical protein